MLENHLRKPGNNPTPGTHRPESPVTKPPRVGASFAQRKARQSRPSDAVIVEGNNVMRNIDRPLPGDVIGRRKSQLHPDVSKKKSAYFESEFAGPNRGDDPAKTRIFDEAMVTAELNTNVIIGDEFAFITDLANHLSNRYQRPMSSIIITLRHGICMLFGGTFEPACTLTIHTLSRLLQPVTNRRNAILIQRHLHETLGVVSTRSYVRFEVTPEENVAIGGKTLAAEIEGISRGTADQKLGMFGKPSKPSRIMKSVKSLSSFKSPSTVNLSENVANQPPTITETPSDDERTSQVEENIHKSAPRRKSLRVALFGNKISPGKRETPE